MESTDYQQLFNELLALAESRGSHAEKLLFLDGGAEISPQVLANLDHKLNHRVNLDKIPPAWHLYPDLGKIPPIDTQTLEFLPPEISEICVCIGGFYQDQVYCQWLGRSPLTPVQMWSTTKIVPMIALIMTTLHRNQNRQIAPIDNWQIDNYALLHIYDRIVDYQDQNFSSNALSAMLKQFFHPLELQSWWQKITGNFSLEFTGLYGEEPYINQPILRDGQQILLTPADVPHRLGQGRNLVSAYDLVRIFTLIGLAHHLSPSARLPWLTTDHYRSITHALARDPAQYVARCLPRVPTFAKMGFGYSAERQRTEIAYGCFVPVHEGQFLSFGLRGYSNLADPDRCARSIDVRVAIAVGQLWQKISNIFTPTDPYLCHA